MKQVVGPQGLVAKGLLGRPEMGAVVRAMNKWLGTGGEGGEHETPSKSAGAKRRRDGAGTSRGVGGGRNKAWVALEDVLAAVGGTCDRVQEQVSNGSGIGWASEALGKLSHVAVALEQLVEVLSGALGEKESQGEEGGGGEARAGAKRKRGGGRGGERKRKKGGATEEEGGERDGAVEGAFEGLLEVDRALLRLLAGEKEEKATLEALCGALACGTPRVVAGARVRSRSCVAEASRCCCPRPRPRPPALSLPSPQVSVSTKNHPHSDPGAPVHVHVVRAGGDKGKPGIGPLLSELAAAGMDDLVLGAAAELVAARGDGALKQGLLGLVETSLRDTVVLRQMPDAHAL